MVALLYVKRLTSFRMTYLLDAELELAQIKYHLRCYKWYRKKSTGIKDSSYDDEIDEVTDGNTDDQTASLALSRTKRRKSTDSLCVICNEKKYMSDLTLYRVCEDDRTNNFLAAFQYHKDDVFTRCFLYKSKEDIYAVDVKSHKK